MKYLAAIALLFVLGGEATAQTSWNNFDAWQRNNELRQIQNELRELNHQQVLSRIHYRPSYRSSYRNSYRSSYRRPTYYRYNTWRPTYGGWGWTNGGF